MEFSQLRDPHFDAKCVGFYVYDVMNTPCLFFFVCYCCRVFLWTLRVEYIISNVKCLKDNVD